MPAQRKWTEEDVTLVRERRDNKCTWDQIATELDCSRHTVILFAKSIGISTGPLPSLRSSETIDPNRLPLPPGHPISWQAITAGTLLEGVVYPL